MKKLKTGNTRPVACCMHCEHCSGNTYCKLYDSYTYHGQICDKYKEDTKKINRKTSAMDRDNKFRTAFQYFNNLNYPVVYLSDVLKGLPKATSKRVQEAFESQGLGPDTELECSLYGEIAAVINPTTTKRVYTFVDYNDCSKVKNVWWDYVYEIAKNEIELQGDEDE